MKVLVADRLPDATLSELRRQHFELDVTTLPCTTSTDCNKLASFRSTQAGYANATGTMTVYFTCDQEAIGNRLPFSNCCLINLLTSALSSTSKIEDLSAVV